MSTGATTVLAATLVAPRRLEVREYPYPSVLEPGAFESSAVLIVSTASSIANASAKVLIVPS